MKCPHCNESLGNGDAYDLMSDHKYSCNSKIASKLRRSEQISNLHGEYCTCEDCV